MLNIRIELGTSGVTKTISISGDQSVAEVLAHIRDQFSELLPGEDTSTFGLYQADVPGVRKARWLRDAKTVGSHELRNGDTLNFRNRQRPIRVKLLDGTQKVCMIDDSETVDVLLSVVGEKIGLDDTTEYGLRIDGSKTWLNNMQSIQEQGVTSDTVLQFKKRYFVDDDNVDKSDQKKLLLVYHQARDSVVSGEYPTKPEEASQFGAIQLQIDHGNYDPEKHTESWVGKEREKILPMAHWKKKMDKAILDQWKKLVNQQRVECYFKYVTFCRALPTYGTTTFEVQEKQDGKSKLQTVLLGISRDRVLRMDPETKEVLEAFSLYHVNRYAAAKTSFTIDFGNYRKDYYSVRTTEGDEISSMLSGYIDILLGRQGGGKIVHDDDGALTAEIEELGPLVTIPNVSTVSMVGVGKYGADDFRQNDLLPGAAELTHGNAGGEQQAGSDLMSAAQAAQRMVGLLDDRLKPGQGIADLPPDLRDDLLAAAHRLGKAVNDMLRDPSADGPARQVTDNLMALIDAARKAAAATHDPTLLDASKRVAQAVADLLKAQAELEANPNDAGARRRLEDAIRRLKGAAAYLNGALNGLLTDPNSEQLLLESARQVADAMKRLAGNANGMNKELLGPPARKMVGSAGTLNENAGMLAPLINDPNAKQEMLNLAKDCSNDTQTLLSGAAAANLTQPQKALVGAAGSHVDVSLTQLLNAMDCASSRAAQNQEQMADAAQSVMDALNALKKAQGKPRDIKRATDQVCDAVPLLMQAAKRAAVNDPQSAGQLLSAARSLGVATKGLVNRAHPAMAEPKDAAKFRELLMSAQQVAQATRELLGHGAKFSIFTTVRSKAKAAAASCTGFANCSRAAIRDTRSRESQAALHGAAKDTSAGTARLVEALKEASQRPDDLTAQARLVDVAKQVAKPMASAVNVSRRVTPDVGDVASRQALTYATKDAGTSLSELVAACAKAAGVTGERDVDEALESLAATQQELQASLLDAEVDALVSPLDRDQGVANLKTALEHVVGATNELKEGKPVGPNAKAAAAAMSDVAGACRAIAANTSGTDNQKALLAAASNMIPDLEDLIRKARSRALDPNEDALSLLEAAKSVQDKMFELLRTTQQGTGAEECQEAADAIEASLNSLQMAPAFVPADIVALSSEVENRAKAVALATHQLQTVSRDNKAKPELLKEAAGNTAAVFPGLITAVNKIAAACKDRTAQDDIIRATQVMGTHVAKVCQFAATAKVDEKSAQNVQKAHRNVLQSIKTLLEALTKATPGIAELEKASAMLNDSAAMKDPLPAGTYNMATLNAATADLGDAAVKLVQAARTEPESLGKHSVQTARAVDDVMNQTRGFSPAAQAKTGAMYIEQRAAHMATTQEPALLVNDVKGIARTVPQVLNAMAVLAQAEDADTRARMKAASQAVQPALTKMLADAKAMGTAGAGPVQGSAKQLSQRINELVALSSQTHAIPELMEAAKGLTATTQRMVQHATTLAKKPGDEASIAAITADGQQLGDQMKAYKAVTKKLAPGHLECEAAAQKAEAAVRELDAAQMSAAVGVLEVIPDKTHQAAQEDMVRIARQLALALAAMQSSVQGQDWEGVGTHATELSDGLSDAVQTAVEVAGTTTNQATQVAHLDHVKGVGDSALHLLHVSADLTADNANQSLNRDMLATANDVRTALQRLLSSLKGGVVGLRACDEAIVVIQEARGKLNGQLSAGAGSPSYAEAQRNLVNEAQGVAVDITQLFQVAKTEPSAVGEPSASLAKAVASMVDATVVAAATSTEPDVRELLVLGAKDVTHAAEGIVASSKKVATDPDNQMFAEELTRAFQTVTERVTGLIRSIRQGATGERDCKDAISSIRRTVAEIDAVAVYVATGDYEAKADSDTLLSLDRVYDEVLAAAQAVSAAGHGVQAGATKGQAQLGAAAKGAAAAVARLGDVSKLMAGVSADVMAQSDALANAKAAGSAQQGVIQAALALQASPQDAALRAALNEAVTAADASVEELRRHLEAALSPQANGVRCLRAGRDRVRSASAALRDDGASSQASPASPQDLVEPLRVLDKQVIALSNVTNTGDPQLAQVVETVASAAERLQKTAQGASLAATNPAAGRRVRVAAAEADDALAALLSTLRAQHKDTDAYQDAVVEQCDALSSAVLAVIEAGRELPGGQDLELHESKLEDQATDELLQAAKIIEAAAAMLMSAPSRVRDPSADLNEDDIAAGILDGARFITQQTYELIKASIAAQKEIKASGRGTDKKSVYKMDQAWAEGLISAAKSVAQCTQDLVHAANATVNHEIGEEAVVATSRMVQGATARLVAASKAKLDLGSPTQEPLNQAAAGVTTATKQLATAAKQAFEFSVTQKEANSGSSKKMTAMAARLKEIESQEAVNKAQRALDAAYRRLKQRRRQEYASANTSIAAQRAAKKVLAGSAASKGKVGGASRADRRMSVGRASPVGRGRAGGRGRARPAAAGRASGGRGGRGGRGRASPAGRGRAAPAAGRGRAGGRGRASPGGRGRGQ